MSRPDFRAAAGMEFQPDRSVNLLLRVGSTGLVVSNSDQYVLVLAKVSGNFAIDPITGEPDLNSEEAKNLVLGKALPYLDIEIVPLGLKLGPDGTMGGQLRFLAMGAGVDVNNGQSARLRVDVVGWEKEKLTELIPQKLFLFYKVIADAAGYKLASHVSSKLARFSGASIAGASGELGLDWYLNETFTLALKLGGRADLAIRFNDPSPSEWDIQSDLAAYVEVSLDFKKLLDLFSGKIFVRNGVNSAVETNVDGQASYQLMAGAELIF